MGNPRKPAKPRPHGKGWILEARERAIELAGFGRLDEDIVATLRAEFPVLEERRAGKRAEDCARVVAELADYLEDCRSAGESRILARLHEISASDSREALTATTWLARERLGHGGATMTRTKNLARAFRNMGPAELRKALGDLQKRLGPRAVHGGEIEGKGEVGDASAASGDE